MYTLWLVWKYVVCQPTHPQQSRESQPVMAISAYMGRICWCIFALIQAAKYSYTPDCATMMDLKEGWVSKFNVMGLRSHPTQKKALCCLMGLLQRKVFSEWHPWALSIVSSATGQPDSPLKQWWFCRKKLVWKFLFEQLQTWKLLVHEN